MSDSIVPVSQKSIKTRLFAMQKKKKHTDRRLCLRSSTLGSHGSNHSALGLAVETRRRIQQKKVHLLTTRTQ